MKPAGIYRALAVIVGFQLIPVLAEEPAGQAGLLERAANVDDPIPETYEPLNSTFVGDGEALNQTIEQSWQLKKQAREREQATAASDGSPARETLEKTIQEPGINPVSSPEPTITDTGNSLEIKGD